MTKKVLFIGLGSIGQRHLRNLRELLGDQVEVLAFRTRNLQHIITPDRKIKEGKLAKEFGIKVFYDLDQALEEKPQITFICNPSSLHIPVALKAAHAGSHLFIEKPLSHSLEGCDDLIKVCKEKELVAFVAYHMRFRPTYQMLKSLLQDQKIGELLSVRSEVGEYLPDWHSYEDYRQMYAARSDLGGGVVLSQIHEIDYIYDLFGMPLKVFALGGKLSSLEVDTEDTVDILLEMQYQNRVLPVSIHMDFIQKPPVRRCVVIGDKGKITVDFQILQIKVEKANEKDQVHCFNDKKMNDFYKEELKHFLSCVELKQAPIVNLEEGCKSLRIALSIKECLKFGTISYVK